MKGRIPDGRGLHDVTGQDGVDQSSTANSSTNQSDCEYCRACKTLPRLAAELGVKTRTTKSWRDQRKGPPVTYISGRPYYRKESVRQWLLKREGKGLRGCI